MNHGDRDAEVDRVSVRASPQFFWRLPAQGDGRGIARDDWTRGDHGVAAGSGYARTASPRDGFTYYDQLVQVARAAELTGFDGVFVPQTPAGEEPLIVAGVLAREVQRLALLPSLPAHFLAPVYAAKIATSFQRLTGGRFAWHLRFEDPGERPWHGRRISHEEQVARAGEWLDIVRGLKDAAPLDYNGRYYEVAQGGFTGPLGRPALPEINLSGDSEAELKLAARHADVYLLAAAPIDAVRARIADLRNRADRHGRTLRFALATDIVARPTDQLAWAQLERQWDRAAQRTVTLDGMPLRHRDSDAFRLSDHLWTGFGELNGYGDAGLVGSYASVAARIADYAALGIDRFVLGANPHLEEAYRIGEHVLPLVAPSTAAAA